MAEWEVELAIIHLDTAITAIEKVRERLIDTTCVYTPDQRIDTLLRRLEDLRVDILRADLPPAA